MRETGPEGHYTFNH